MSESETIVGSYMQGSTSLDESRLTVELLHDYSDPYLQNVDEITVEDCDVGNNENSDIPSVGMRFRTHHEAYNFYNNYAGIVGFSVRRQTQTKSKKGVSSMRFTCSKEGIGQRQKNHEAPLGSLNKLNTPEKEKGITRTGCKAAFRIRLVEGNMWEVSVFEPNHNHSLVVSPAKKRNLRSQKRMSKEVVSTIQNLNAQNVGTSQILEYIAIHCGGKGNLHLKKQDVTNIIAAINRKLNGIDVSTTVMYFRKKQEEDHEFFYAIEPDENGAAKNIFWVDGRARRAYQEFGDVVTFDTTYQTNKYSMPLAPFIGVNHHRFSIFYGMALLSNESAPNFCWLFKTWLQAMYGKHPRAILTDQDPAMRKAIKLVFPETIHRCCQWHVMRKAREHLGVLYNQLEGFDDELGRVINRSLTVPEFEDRWGKMLDKYKLHENNHLKVMFTSASEWIPTYFRHIFFAGMSTTQRSESMNALFKLWVSSHTSIYQFVLQIEKMIDGIWHRESDEDLKTMNEIPQLWSHYQMEAEARKVYTTNVFLLFKVLVKESLLGFVKEIKKDVLYEVNISYHSFIRNFVPESYIVEVDREQEIVSCNCKGFLFEGLLCSHDFDMIVFALGEHQLHFVWMIK